MALTDQEIRDIGARVGVKLVERCKERAEVVLDSIHELKEHENAILFSASKPKKAKEEMLFQINSQIETVKEFYPESPLKNILLNDLADIKAEALNTDKENPQPSILKVAEKYGSAEGDLLRLMLTDFAYCQCGS